MTKKKINKTNKKTHTMKITANLAGRLSIRYRHSLAAIYIN